MLLDSDKSRIGGAAGIIVHQVPTVDVSHGLCLGFWCAASRADTTRRDGYLGRDDRRVNVIANTLERVERLGWTRKHCAFRLNMQVSAWTVCSRRLPCGLLV